MLFVWCLCARVCMRADVLCFYTLFFHALLCKYYQKKPTMKKITVKDMSSQRMRRILSRDSVSVSSRCPVAIASSKVNNLAFPRFLGLGTGLGSGKQHANGSF